MNENQDLINTNVQERLCKLECEQQIMTAFFYAVIATHPEPEQLKPVFFEGSERIIASNMSKALPDAWLRQSIDYRDMLMHGIDRKIAGKL